MQEITFFKLSNGDDIIGEIRKQTRKTIIVHMPMAAISQIDEDISMTYLEKWIPILSDSLVPIERKDIIAMVPVEEEVAGYYREALEDIETNENKHRSQQKTIEKPEEERREHFYKTYLERMEPAANTLWN